MSQAMTRTILVARLEALLPAAMDDAEFSPTSWANLVDAGMSGRQIFRLFELTEEACGVTVCVADILDWVMGRPTLNALALLVERRRYEVAQGQIGGAA